MQNYFFSVIPYQSEFKSYQKLTSQVYRKYLQVSNLQKLQKLDELRKWQLNLSFLLIAKMTSFNSKNDKF